MPAYKSFCWALGTTSFRTDNFNQTIEEQLSLLNRFWEKEENRSEIWEANNDLQARYYDFMKSEGFVDGDAKNKPKDAREKTSGLADIGLITAGRRLTQAGNALLAISMKNDFRTDNFFRISKDSYIYLKQLLKTANPIDGNDVRPFLVLIHLLCEFEYLTLEEFTYILPLCTSPIYTERMTVGIHQIRNGEIGVDELILARLTDMENYREALDDFLQNEVSEDSICEMGMNRKSRSYDRAYYPLYRALYDFYLNGNESAVYDIFKATKPIKIGKWWRGYLFSTIAEKVIQKKQRETLRPTLFDAVSDETELKKVFFRVMHLFKAKATLSDYLDLNRRYIKTTDTVLFEDGIVRFDIVPKHFFRLIEKELYASAYTRSEMLMDDCELEKIAPCLVMNESHIVRAVREELGVEIQTVAEAQNALDDSRYARFAHLVDTRFTDEKLLALLQCFEQREDAEIRRAVSDNADIPTIFEYVLAVFWYKISERKGKILDYMKLSLDADLLPKTHAAGGEADIVYEYEATSFYPAHTLLLEATLADGSNQRRMEMEPVSRHLGQHLIRNGADSAYCLFVTTDLNINVISDFRGRKFMPYYDSQDFSKYVMGMKILPLQTSDLKNILLHGWTYSRLYLLFENAHESLLPPHVWYKDCVASLLAEPTGKNIQ